MGARDLPDIYTHGPDGPCWGVRQITQAHDTTDMYHANCRLRARGRLIT